jgi:hypothetical protein
MRKPVFILFLFVVTVSLFALETGQLNGTQWRVTISGNTELLLNLKMNGGRFALTSRKGSTQDILGGQYLMARMSGKVNPTTIQVIGTYHVDNDTVILTGKYSSLTSKQTFAGKIFDRQLEAVMSNNVMKGRIHDTGEALADYAAIATEALQVTELNLYNPLLLESKAWKAFRKKVADLAARVKDDYEFEKAFNFQVSGLPFSHYGISIPIPEQPVSPTPLTTTLKAPSKFAIKQVNDQTVVFTVKTFSASAGEIIPFIDTLKMLNPGNLIIDLRNNGGGTIASALPLVSYLVNDTLYGGIFLTRKYFSTHDNLPNTSDYQNFPLFSEASFPLIIEGIHKHNGLCLVVYPDADHYKGRVYILANSKTASTCEPIVYGLKYNKRATIVGERTAGAMLNGERFELPGKFNLWMPTADYYTVDGKKLDKIGVEPDFPVQSELALDTTLELLK